MELEQNEMVNNFNNVLTSDHFDNYKIPTNNKTPLLTMESREMGEEKMNGSSIDPEDYDFIWKCFTLSIATALNDSEELALCYISRLKFLYHLLKFKECVVDIDNALRIIKCHLLKAELYCRKVICLVELDQLPNANNALMKSKVHLNRYDGPQTEHVRKLQSLVKDTEQILDYNISKDRKKKKNSPIESQIKTPVDDFSGVTEKFEKGFSKHLVAARNYAPGEMILVLKPYSKWIGKDSSMNPYCSHCLAPCLATIPCKKCIWFMCCSEKCREISWNEYHDVECAIMKGFKEKYFENCRAALRMVIIECRKREGIANLKAYIKSLGSCDSAEKFQKYCDNRNIQSNELEVMYTMAQFVEAPLELIKMVWIMLCNLVYTTNFFEKNFIPDRWRMLVKNEDVIFIGSLILRLSKSFIHFKAIINFNESPLPQYIGNTNGISKSCISTVYSLIRHSCTPNVFQQLNTDNNIVIYAIKPIKKNAKLFVSYLINPEKMGSIIRQKILKQKFNIDCHCTACKENWLEQDVVTFCFNFLKPDVSDKMDKGLLEVKLLKKHEAAIRSSFTLSPRFQYTKKVLTDLSMSIIIATNTLAHTSIVTSVLIKTLNVVFFHLYGVHDPIPNAKVR